MLTNVPFINIDDLNVIVIVIVINVDVMFMIWLGFWCLFGFDESNGDSSNSSTFPFFQHFLSYSREISVLEICSLKTNQILQPLITLCLFNKLCIFQYISYCFAYTIFQYIRYG